jgi:hypothetical protein
VKCGAESIEWHPGRRHASSEVEVGVAIALKVALEWPAMTHGPSAKTSTLEFLSAHLVKV